MNQSASECVHILAAMLFSSRPTQILPRCVWSVWHPISSASLLRSHSTGASVLRLLFAWMLEVPETQDAWAWTLGALFFSLFCHRLLPGRRHEEPTLDVSSLWAPCLQGSLPAMRLSLLESCRARQWWKVSFFLPLRDRHRCRSLQQQAARRRRRRVNDDNPHLPTSLEDHRDEHPVAPGPQ